MLRLFTAIALPEAIRDRLMVLMGGMPGARWQSRAQLHLTLRFIGEVAPARAEDIDAALAGVRFEEFAIALAGCGYFGRPDAPRLLWAGVAPTAPVAALHERIERALVRQGLVPAGRRYHPHVTLARFGGRPRPGALDSFVNANALFRTADFPVTGFDLVRSTLAHTGAHYEALRTYPPAR